jgi:hypothetical protein
MSAMFLCVRLKTLVVVDGGVKIALVVCLAMGTLYVNRSLRRYVCARNLS